VTGVTTSWAHNLTWTAASGTATPGLVGSTPATLSGSLHYQEQQVNSCTTTTSVDWTTADAGAVATVVVFQAVPSAYAVGASIEFPNGLPVTVTDHAPCNSATTTRQVFRLQVTKEGITTVDVGGSVLRGTVSVAPVEWGQSFEVDRFSGPSVGASLTFNLADVTVATPPNAAPVATDDTYRAVRASALIKSATDGVLANDTDANSDPLTAIKVSDAAHGTVTLHADGSFTYVPAARYVGPDSFTYKANDGTEDSNPGIVAITVGQPIPEAICSPAFPTRTACRRAVDRRRFH
jgi:VCBS repeat-containing protein